MGKTKKTTAAPTVTESVSQPSPNKPGYFAHGGRNIAVIIAALLLIVGVGGAIYKIDHKTESPNIKPGSAQSKAYDLISQANTATSKDDYRSALNYYREADRIWPNQPDILSNLGATYFQLKDKINTVYYYKQAIKITKSNPKSPFKSNIKTWQDTIDQANKSDFEFKDGASN